MRRRQAAAAIPAQQTIPAAGFQVGEAKAFARALRVVKPFASKTGERFLNQVALRFDGDRWILVASDGHTLARWTSNGFYNTPMVDYAINLSDVEEIVDLYKKDAGALSITPSNGSLQLRSDESFKIVKMPTSPFPKWESVLPKDEDSAFTNTIGADPEYLERAFGAYREALKGLKDQTGAQRACFTQLQFTKYAGGAAGDPTSSAMRIVSREVPQLYVLVMPARL